MPARWGFDSSVERYFTGAGFSGVVLLAEDPRFEGARRIWNGMIDRTPALIACCRGTPDVKTAIGFARETGRPLSVRCGGHNVAGSAVAEGAVMIDLSLMRAVVVDPGARIARASGGCLLRDLDLATTPHGLACPAGVFSLTGLGGLALGGGYGWRCRKLGLTCDHIIGAEVVLADGSVAEVSESQHPDLLWALRGGGGNFGIVTRFTLRLDPAGPMLVRSAVHPVERAVEAMRAYRAFAPGLSDDLHLLGGLRRAAPADPVPPGQRDRPVLGVTIVCSAANAASTGEGRALFEAMPACTVAARTISYLDLQSMGDSGSPAGRRYYTKSGYLAGLCDEAIERLIASSGRNPSHTGSIDVEYLRGAVLRSGPSQSAFPQREAPFMVTVSGSWDDPGLDQDGIAWAREAIDSVHTWEHPGAYSNYISQHESPQQASAMYGSAIYSRLAQVKQAYDPDNMFRSARNILPASTPEPPRDTATA
jgi:FAD/FMN-containing dehydrogenase